MNLINVAMLQDDVVADLFVLDESAVDAFAVVLGKTLIAASELGLCIGDYSTDGGASWYRSIDGIAVPLPLPKEEPKEELDERDAALELLGVTIHG